MGVFERTGKRVQAAAYKAVNNVTDTAIQVVPKPLRKHLPGAAEKPTAAPAAKPNAQTSFSDNLIDIGADAVSKAYKRVVSSPDDFSIPDPQVVSKAMSTGLLHLLFSPSHFLVAQGSLIRDNADFFTMAVQRMMGQPVKPVVQPTSDDKRFKDNAWSDAMSFDLIKQFYLVNSHWLENTMKTVPGLDRHTAHMVEFYTKQIINALAPSNFPLTNPKVFKTTLDSRGENLIKGLRNLLNDMRRGNGRLDMRLTDTEAFELGKDIATTPGKVVFQNDLTQLIQYSPTTEKVQRRPILIMPPWINKFYSLDLRPNNSLVKWLTDQGFTVFIISWVNPNQELRRKSFIDYMKEGPLAALDAIHKATGEKEVDVAGYCIGGTLLATTVGYLAAKGDKRIASATFITTLTDFSDAGDVAVFIDEPQLKKLEEHMQETGYLESHFMANVFNMLRSNDLIWSNAVNQYLLGQDPKPFDLLYWNADATRMPAAMHTYYLRNMYLENRLVKPGALVIEGVAIDLSKVEIPTYIISTREDHIAPWKSTYAATQLYGGPIRFVLAGSGHVAGVVAPPGPAARGYWVNDKLPKDPEVWLDNAQQMAGSWWQDWKAWLEPHSKDQVPARVPGAGKLKAIEDAPGSYVKVRARD